MHVPKRRRFSALALPEAPAYPADRTGVVMETLELALDETLLNDTALCVIRDGEAEWKIVARCCGASAIVCTRHRIWHRQRYEPNGRNGWCRDCDRAVSGSVSYDDLYSVIPI